jgi:hypothetical protein
MKATTNVTTKFQPIELTLVIESEQELHHLQSIFQRNIGIPSLIHPNEYHKQSELVPTMREVWYAIRNL